MKTYNHTIFHIEIRALLRCGRIDADRVYIQKIGCFRDVDVPVYAETFLDRLRLELNKSPDFSPLLELDTINRRKFINYGHVMRSTQKYELLQLIRQWKVASRKRPGRRRNSCIRNLRQWFGKRTRGLFKAAIPSYKSL